jgi:hypothetical protein
MSCNVLDFGAKGDGSSDDTTALQTAIDCARNNSLTVVLPAGNYKITRFLDWGSWTGISVLGDGASSCEGLSCGVAVTKITATNIQGVAHDFTGSGYGKIENIAFTGGAEVMVLNGRTSNSTAGGGIYGSDILWRGCNFAGGSLASFVNHMGEAPAVLCNPTRTVTCTVNPNPNRRF